ncbi:hypothetical protein CLOP_g9522 [Closterium sp. NIES-67]|nr:hypothetical protein CLOP_g9522 [Closterium sp. NIES-67]
MVLKCRTPSARARWVAIMEPMLPRSARCELLPPRSSNRPILWVLLLPLPRASQTPFPETSDDTHPRLKAVQPRNTRSRRRVWWDVGNLQIHVSSHAARSQPFMTIPPHHKQISQILIRPISQHSPYKQNQLPA